jgi:hypothetical protein
MKVFYSSARILSNKIIPAIYFIIIKILNLIEKEFAN